MCVISRINIQYNTYFNINLDLKMKYETYCAIDLFLHEKVLSKILLNIILGVNLCVCVCVCVCGK